VMFVLHKTSHVAAQLVQGGREKKKAAKQGGEGGKEK
jgi:hypothetical protein